MAARGAAGAAGGLALGVLALGAPGCSRKGAPAAQPIVVAAAADLAFAFRDVGQAFEKATGQPVAFSFGSTGLLERQIAEGGPFDVFAAANVQYADDAIGSGACDGATKALFAVGRIVVFTADGAPFAPRSLADLAGAGVRKVAIANPDHAPYGKAARQALERSGLLDAVGPKLVYGENVQQTLQFAQSGNADAAIVALSLAKMTPGRFVEVPSEVYDRIEQAIVVCKNGKAGPAAGRRFASFVQSDEGKGILGRYGFER